MTDDRTAPVSQLMLRICESLHDRLESAAQTSQRSLNAEIVARLEASFREGSDGSLLARMHRLEDLTLATTASADA
jgi:hypothetical protein